MNWMSPSLCLSGCNSFLHTSTQEIRYHNCCNRVKTSGKLPSSLTPLYRSSKPLSGSVGSWYEHRSSVWHFARQKSKRSTRVEAEQSSVLFPRSVSFCSWAEPPNASVLQQGSIVVNRTEACGCKKKVWRKPTECECEPRYCYKRQRSLGQVIREGLKVF